MEYLHNRRLQWFCNPEKTKESAWSSKCRTFQKLIADCPDNNIV